MSDVNISAIALVTLFAALALAATLDLQESRVPNWLVAGMLITGAAFALAGFSQLSFLESLAGAGVGLVLLLPFYALGGMGAGDVKLMAGAGAFLGPWGAGYGVFASLIIGSVAAICYALYLRWQRSQQTTAVDSPLDGVGPATEPTQSIGQTRFPYAPCIALGVAIVAVNQFLNL